MRVLLNSSFTPPESVQNRTSFNGHPSPREPIADANIGMSDSPSRESAQDKLSVVDSTDSEDGGAALYEETSQMTTSDEKSATEDENLMDDETISNQLIWLKLILRRSNSSTEDAEGDACLAILQNERYSRIFEERYSTFSQRHAENSHRNETLNEHGERFTPAPARLGSSRARETLLADATVPCNRSHWELWKKDLARLAANKELMSPAAARYILKALVRMEEDGTNSPGQNLAEGGFEGGVLSPHTQEARSEFRVALQSAIQRVENDDLAQSTD